MRVDSLYSASCGFLTIIHGWTIFRKKMAESHPHLGVKPCRLLGIQLPTSGDVVGRVMMLRLQKMEEKTPDFSRLSIKDCITQGADEVLSIWKRAPVPTRCRYHVIEMTRQLWANGDNMCNSWESKRARWVPQPQQG